MVPLRGLRACHCVHHSQRIKPHRIFLRIKPHGVPGDELADRVASIMAAHCEALHWAELTRARTIAVYLNAMGLGLRTAVPVLGSSTVYFEVVQRVALSGCALAPSFSRLSLPARLSLPSRLFSRLSLSRLISERSSRRSGSMPPWSSGKWLRKYESCLTHGSSSRAHGARGRPPATASSRELPPHHRTCGEGEG